MDRKYKQRGYQDSGGSRERTERQPVKKLESFGPKTPNMRRSTASSMSSMCLEMTYFEKPVSSTGTWMAGITALGSA